MSRENFLVRLIGYPATLIHGDSTVLDRWFFLRRHLIPGNLRTLDAGSGSGAMSIYAAKLGNEVVGLSLSSRDNEVAAARAEILGIQGASFVTGNLGNLREIALNWQLFDQAICFETIEHIFADRKLVADLFFLLKPGGRLILTTPYKHYRVLPGDKLSEIEDGGHVRWGYTHEDLREILSEAGFEIKVEEYISGYFSQLALRIQRKLGEFGFPDKLAWSLSFPFRILRVLDPLLAKFSNYPALSVAVVAVKR